METYLLPIRVALLTFPIVAFLFTLPYVILQYRKFERIPMLKVLVTYSFIFYMMAAYYLVILPLPSIESVEKMNAANHVILQPLESLRDYIGKSGLSWRSKTDLFAILRSTAILQLVFNVLLTLPFGIYLRYYFRRNWWQTLLMSFALSLFFELTQLTGLYWIYPKPYRFFELDDLLCNTLGGMLGFLVAPVLHTFLPHRGELDRKAQRRTAQVSVVRRVCAALVDWILAFGVYWVSCFILSIVLHYSVWSITKVRLGAFLFVLLYAVVCSIATGGYTAGLWMFRLRIRRHDGSAGRIWQYSLRYLLLYGAIYSGPVWIAVLFSYVPDLPMTWQYVGGGVIILLAVLFFMFCFETLLKLFGSQEPYRYDVLCRTQCISVPLSRQMHELSDKDRD